MSSVALALPVASAGFELAVGPDRVHSFNLHLALVVRDAHEIQRVAFQQVPGV